MTATDQGTLLGSTCRECGAPIPYCGHGRKRSLCDGCYPEAYPARKLARNIPRARSGDPVTSRQAAARNADSAQAVEARIRASFRAFAYLTDDELCAVTEGLPATIKTARSRMKNRGEIVKTGLKRPSNTGSPMMVWRLA